MKRKAMFVVFGAAVCGAAYAWFAQGSSLYVKGNLASTGVIERNGVAYAPIKDLAKAMNLTVAKTSRGYELSEGGGANMVTGLNGKVGDELFNGRHKFKVVKVFRGPEYTNQFSGDGLVVRGYGNDVVAVTCRVKNGTKQAVTYDLFMGSKTALTDTDEHSFNPYQGGAVDALSRGPSVLPGAAYDFALTFTVPKNAVLKDLVYQIQDFSGKLDQIFRVSLQ